MVYRDQQFRDQPQLFDAAVVTMSDEGERSRNETYREDVLPEVSQKQKLIMARIIAAGSKGMTLDQLSAQMHVPANALSGRVTELVRLGRVQHTKERRRTRAGSTASVIVASEFSSQPTLPTFQDHPTPNETNAMPTSSEAMPDQLTCLKRPRDQCGDRIEANTQYLINGCRVLCYEDDKGSMFIQKCTRGGTRLPGSTPQPMELLPANARPFRLLDCQ